MKRIFLILLTGILSVLLLSGVALAEKSKTKTVPVKKEKHEETELPPDSWSKRMPSAPVMCVISENGITIDGADTNEITLYEVYDDSGYCLVSYSSERDFISFLYNTDMDVELRLYADGYVYSGWW